MIGEYVCKTCGERGHTNMITLLEFQAANEVRNPKAFPGCKEWKPVDWSNALAGEVGEVCNAVKKLKRDGDTPERRQEIADEIADVVCYASLLCSSLDILMDDACRRKFNAVSVKRSVDDQL